MITNLKKHKHTKVLIYILLIALCIAMLPITALGGQEDPKDVSGKINISNISMTFLENEEWKDYMTGGAIVDNEKDRIFEKGTGVRFYVTWSVSPENIKNISEGDFFLVPLPKQYFTFSNLGPVDVTDSTGQLIGLYTLENQTMKLVFSDIVDKTTTKEIKDGWLMAKGTLSASDIPENAVSIGGITIPVTAQEPIAPGEGDDKPIGPLDPSKKGTPDPLTKSGSVNNDKQTVNWYVSLNQDMYRAKYNGLTSRYQDKHNVVIEDKLATGQKIKDIQFSHSFYYAYYDDDYDILNMAKEYFDVYYDTELNFTRVEANSGESYDSFRSRVINQGRTGTKPAFGIWQDKYFILSLGDIPGKLKMPLTYGELASRLATNEYNGYKIPDSVKNDTLTAYADKFYGSTDSNSLASAYSLNIKIGADITGGSRSLENEVSMYTEDELDTTAGAILRFEAIAGAAELGAPGSVTILKYDGETEGTLDGVKFKLQKMNSESVYEDYTPNDGDMIRSTSDGAIVYLNLDYGNYRVVEVEGLPGYSDTITFINGDGTFTINGSEEGTIYVDINNFKESVFDEVVEPTDDDDTPVVLGEENMPGDNNSKVLGEEASTADLANNLMQLLIITLVILVILLIAELRLGRRRT